MKKSITIPIFVVAVLIIGLVVWTKQTQAPIDVTNKTSSTENSMNDTAQEIKIDPISHATMVLTVGDVVVYTDPVGGADAFKGKAEPDIILVTDIHGDHFNNDTLEAVSMSKTIIVVPQAVKDQLKPGIQGSVVVLNNGGITDQLGIKITGVPMYNLPESGTAPHAKGRGNGYVLEGSGKRIYISGDTSGTPEMKSLQNIDIAFICMNLPYTMSVEEAASAVLAFKPKRVIPYHYRGQDGLSDTDKFKELVNSKDSDIQVDLVNFYPQK